jgi:hypothetical protein
MVGACDTIIDKAPPNPAPGRLHLDHLSWTIERPRSECQNPIADQDGRSRRRTLSGMARFML